MIITNFKSLARNSLRKKALLIAEAGYKAIDIEKVIFKKIRLKNDKLEILIHSDIFSDAAIRTDSGKKQGQFIEIDLNTFSRIFIVGIGKGSSIAVSAFAKILLPLDSKLASGIALDVKIPNSKIQISNKFQNPNFKIKFYQGDHPLPSGQNIKATHEIIKLANDLKRDDLLITFICGGGSALTCASEEELKNSTFATKELTKAGATIEELNTVRKHLSEFKGGGLAKMACPATVISLIVSDVCGNDLSLVASGPTVYDKTTRKDAEKILKKYGLNPVDFNLNETPKNKKCFINTKNILFVCNQDAINGMLKKAEELGFAVKIHSLALEGEAKIVLIPMIENIKNGETIIAAGEITVALTNNQRLMTNDKLGKGGRNQEAVLGAIAQLMTNDQTRSRASSLRGRQLTTDIIFLSLASDAHDNTEAAGAIGDYLTLEKAEKLKLNPKEFLENHDSFNFFKKTGDLIYAKQKCFNVADLMIVLKE